MDQGVIGIPIVQVEDHNDARGVRVKFCTDAFVVFVPTHVEEVYSDGLTFDLELLDTVVDTDGLDVSLYKLFLTISLDQTAFTHFRVTNRDNLKRDDLRGRHTAIGASSI